MARAAGLRPKPPEPADVLRPRVLAHLAAYPSLSFSVREVARAIGGDETSVRRRLRELEAAGKVTSATGPRAPGETDIVTTWRLARADSQVTGTDDVATAAGGENGNGQRT